MGRNPTSTSFRRPTHQPASAGFLFALPGFAASRVIAISISWCRPPPSRCKFFSDRELDGKINEAIAAQDWGKAQDLAVTPRQKQMVMEAVTLGKKTRHR